jgi:hypothetical protein
MWPAEASNLVRDAQFIYLFCSIFFMETASVCLNIWLLNIQKKILGPSLDLSCAPLVYFLTSACLHVLVFCNLYYDHQ